MSETAVAGDSARPEPAGAPSIRGVTLQPATYSVSVEGRLVPLSPQELKLLQILMGNAGRVLSFPFLLQQAWGQERMDDSRTLKTHILRLRRKIERNPHAPLFIRTVRGAGYIFDVDDPKTRC